MIWSEAAFVVFSLSVALFGIYLKYKESAEKRRKRG